MFVGALVDRQGALRNGWRILGFLALLAFAGFLSVPFGRTWPVTWRVVLPPRWLDAALVLLVSGACLRLEGRPLASLGLRLDRRFLRHLALGTAGGLLFILATALMVRALGGFHWVRTPGSGAADLAAGAWLYLAVAWYEELLFRGYPFQRAVSGLGFAGAQVAFAAFFALGHWGNPGMAGATKAWATLNIGLAALLLAFCWRRTGSLALPIGVHLGWNWAQGPLLGFGVSGTEDAGWWAPVFHGRPEWLTGGAFGLEASAACTVLCGLAILGLWRWKGDAPIGGASTASGS
jgi:membrane protease YdiL (CAAX protease family)